jgi:uncharacterized protein YndB with AHSA1/START domain
MPVKKCTDGTRRSVEIGFDLPGTPDQVWQAIATGPGISSWFVPTEVEERVGGAVAFHLGPDMTSTGRVTVFDPPHRIAYEEPGWSGEAPPLATEFIVEARGGGTCTVRVVHSLFTERGDWDNEIGSMETGWTAFFAVLAVYLRHFAGQPAASARPTGHFAGTHDAAVAALREALNLTDAAVGDHRATSMDGGPHLAGVVERIGATAHSSELMLRLDRPGPGIALIGSYVWGGVVNVAVSLYFYGDEAPALAAREAEIWQRWIERQFPSGWAEVDYDG